MFDRIRQVWTALKALPETVERLAILECGFRSHPERLRRLEGLCKVGVDVHVHGESWAVVCVAGRPDWVQFVSLGNKHFRRDNQHIDCSPAMLGLFENK